MTPHIEAKREDIAPIVLMPGDPKRAQFIALTYLEQPKLVNQVRGMLGYTGTYRGISVTVMGSGMGMPSMGIYSHELFDKYQVDTIIRIGSCGSYREEIHPMEVILASLAETESNYAYQSSREEITSLAASEKWNARLKESALKKNIPIHQGPIRSSDCFYRTVEEDKNALPYLGEEMESFALFYNAQKFQRHAACILTVSDNLLTGESLTPTEREQSFRQAIEIVLDALPRETSENFEKSS